MKLETFIAFRYLKSPRADKSISAITALSTVGVCLGVTALVVVLSIMNGFERDLKQALIGANPHLTIHSLDFDENLIPDDPALLVQVERMIPTKGVLPQISNQALLTGKGKPSGAYVRGVDPESEIKFETMRSYLRLSDDDPRDLPPDERVAMERRILGGLGEKIVEVQTRDGKSRREKLAGVVLGKLLARNLNVGVGDFVQMYSSIERVSPMGNLARAKKLRVVGLYSTGLAGYDEVLAFIDLKVAQKVFRMDGAINSISVYVADPGSVSEYSATLRTFFDLPYLVRTWMEDNQNLFHVIQLEKFGLAVILTLIILVAAFNIISSLIMMVNEKKKDVAVFKSLGAPDSAVLKIFLVQGTVIGLAGTLGGILLGLLICLGLLNFDVIEIPQDVYVNNRIPVFVDWTQIALIALVSFLICFLVTLYPSKQAARMNPVQGLKQ